MTAKLKELESALVNINKLRDAEYSFAWRRTITENGLYIWPATGNHTVWRDIALFACSVDEYAHPVITEINGVEDIVFEVFVY